MNKRLTFLATLLALNILVPTVSACTVGLTPGYWKNTRKHIAAWDEAGFSPDDTLDVMFPSLDGTGWDDYTLIEALKFHGGNGIDGARRILLRAAVATVLSQHYFDSSDYDKEYAVNIIEWYFFAQPRAFLLDKAAQLDAFNNLGPP